MIKIDADNCKGCGRCVAACPKKCLEIAADKDGACGASLAGSEKLAFEGGTCFTMTLWVRMDAPQEKQAPIVSNKDWESGANPGFVLVGARTTDAVKRPGVCFNCALGGEVRRLDEGDIELDKKFRHTIEVIVDRVVLKPSATTRIAESVETAIRGRTVLFVMADTATTEALINAFHAASPEA